jgi:hypothetical protein
MTDKLEESIRAGLDAGQILESPVYQRAYANLEKEYTESWQQTNVKDHEAREKLYLMVRLLQKVQLDMQNLMTSGQLDHKRLMELRGEKPSAFQSFLRY